jgi:hypothetical protein
MVKVLIHGGQDVNAVRRHLGYVNRRGELDIETDDGEQVRGKGVEKKLLEDWDLDVEEHRRRMDLGPRKDRRPPKLVHKILFSMPPGTPPVRVLEAVKTFAREEFGLKHRYAMVLHTDEPHPHVHLVVKAISEQGKRLHIRKATLRQWRLEFARNLREHGVTANATDRAVRGQEKGHKIDGIYRPMHDEQRSSSHMEARVRAVTEEITKSGILLETGKSRLVATRKEVKRGWLRVSEILLGEGQPELAKYTRQFAESMVDPRTEREHIAIKLLHNQSRQRDLKKPGITR